MIQDYRGSHRNTSAMIQGNGSFVVYTKVQGWDHNMDDQDEPHSSSPASSNDSDATETTSGSGGEEAEESNEEVGQSDASSGSRSTGSDDKEEEDNGEEVEQSDASNGDEEGEDDGHEVSDASHGDDEEVEQSDASNGDEDEQDNGEEVEHSNASHCDEEEEDDGEEVKQSDVSSGDKEGEDDGDQVEQSEASSGDEEEDDDGKEVEQSDTSSGDEKEEDYGKEVEQSDASSGDEEGEDNGEEVKQSDVSSGDKEGEDDGDEVEQSEASSGYEEEDDDGKEVEQSDTSSGDEKEEDYGKEVEQSDASGGDEEGEDNGEVKQSHVSSGDKEGKYDGKEVKQIDANSGGKEEEDNGQEVEQNDTSSDGGSASDGCAEEEKYDEEEEQSNTNNANDDGDLAFQLVHGNCKFNTKGMNNFDRKVNLSQRGRSYAVVAIMGPQSSGKSTLLNHLFRTSFKEMNEFDGRSQTTKGIWLARCPDIEPLTLVMDMEGTDGSERGEDTSFENRSALFALAIADVVLINIWFKDIGLNNAANLPLLKTVFEQVLVPFCDKPRKITLMFVVRDKKESSPEKKLEVQLKKNVTKIWSSIQKPAGINDIKLSDFFKVEVKFLPHYEYRLSDFKMEVEKLKQRFVNSTAPGGLVGDQKDSASGFSSTVKIIWDEIMANKNLTLPSLQVMVATIRCDEIKEEKYESFEKNEVWCKLYQRKDDFFKRDFGEIVNSILNTCVSEYDAETGHFHEATRKNKREELKEKLLKCVEPVYLHNMGNLRLQYLRKFMEAIDRTSDEQNTFTRFAYGCMKDCLQEFKKDCEATKIDLANWDTSEAYAKLEFLMRKHINAKGEAKVDSKIRRLYEPDLKLKLLDRVRYLLCEETDPTWSKVRSHLKSVTKSTISELNVTLSEYAISEEGRKQRIEGIESYAKEIIEAKVREESGRAKEHMMTKFLKIFKADRDWNNVQEINSAAKDAKYTPMDVLVGLTAIRLEDGVADNIGHILCSALLGSGDPNLSKVMASYPWAKHLLVLRDWEAIRAKAGNDIGHMLSSAVLGSGNPNTLKLLNSSSWPQVPPGRTLIKPIECKELWDMYLFEVENAVNKAIKDFEAKGKSPCGCNCCTIM